MKKFLEEYGWTIVLAIVVILIVSITSPLGGLIKGSITNIVNGFGAKTNFERIDNIGPVSDDNDSGEQLDLTNINIAGVIGDFSTKGNLVTINGNLFRVLSVNGTKVKVMMIDNYTNAKFNITSIMTLFGEASGQKYGDSNLDNTMMDYYNSLPSIIQNAIVEQNINQTMYFFSWDVPIGSTTTSTAYDGNDYVLEKKEAINVGNRKVYALDVDDVLEYLGPNFTWRQLNKMIFNIEYAASRSAWLRSASFKNGGVIRAFGYGGLDYIYCINNIEVHPAFILDLNLLS